MNTDKTTKKTKQKIKKQNENPVKNKTKEEISSAIAPVENQHNELCRDCIFDCKQKIGVAILSCPKKIKIDEQLTLFNKNGKPRKWR